MNGNSEFCGKGEVLGMNGRRYSPIWKVVSVAAAAAGNCESGWDVSTPRL